VLVDSRCPPTTRLAIRQFVTDKPEPASARAADSLDGTQGDLDHTGGKAWDESPRATVAARNPDAKSPPGIQNVPQTTRCCVRHPGACATASVVASFAICSIRPDHLDAVEAAGHHEVGDQACVLRHDEQARPVTRRRISSPIRSGRL